MMTNITSFTIKCCWLKSKLKYTSHRQIGRAPSRLTSLTIYVSRFSTVSCFSVPYIFITKEQGNRHNECLHVCNNFIFCNYY